MPISLPSSRPHPQSAFKGVSSPSTAHASDAHARLSSLEHMQQEIMINCWRGMSGTPEQIFFFVETCLTDPTLHLRPLFLREGTSYADMVKLDICRMKALCYMKEVLNHLEEQHPEHRGICTQLIEGLTIMHDKINNTKSCASPSPPQDPKNDPH